VSEQLFDEKNIERPGVMYCIVKYVNMEVFTCHSQNKRWQQMLLHFPCGNHIEKKLEHLNLYFKRQRFKLSLTTIEESPG
jgi:hypothetical protein